MIRTILGSDCDSDIGREEVEGMPLAFIPDSDLKVVSRGREDCSFHKMEIACDQQI